MKRLFWIGAFSITGLISIFILSAKKNDKEGIEYIYTSLAPTPIGPYNQAVKFDEMVYLSGQIALRPDGVLDTADIQKETVRIMENLKEVLSAAGTSIDRVLKTTIYLTDMKYYPEVNKVYGTYFVEGKAPARETVAVKSLPKGARIEISMVAAD